MSAAQIRLATLVRREVSRFMKIKRQTVGAPLLETFLYISVFGAALGTRINTLHGFEYVVFVIPGLIMMAWAINAFSNNSSSILQQKFQRAIDDQLSSPASPSELLFAFTAGGFLRGMVVGTLTFIAASFLVDLPVSEPLILIPGLFLTGFFFAQLGVLVGVRAEQFDDVSFAQTFVLQPLIFLGGVFYSASLLPEPFETLTQFNPIYYMISLIRYGFLGYEETNIALSLLFLSARDSRTVRAQPQPVQAGVQAARLSDEQHVAKPPGRGDLSCQHPREGNDDGSTACSAASRLDGLRAHGVWRRRVAHDQRRDHIERRSDDTAGRGHDRGSGTGRGR